MMKLVKLITMLGLLLFSMQSFASELICEEGTSVSAIARKITEQIRIHKVSTRPLMVIDNGYAYICVVTD